MALPEGAYRSYSGSAVPTTLAGNISDSSSSLQVLDGSTYPDAAGSRWTAIIIDQGQPNEEVVWYGARTGNTFSSLIRGGDGTLAAAHSVGATIKHVYTALDAREANAHYANPDASFVPHTQLVHKTVGQLIPAPHNFTGNIVMSGTLTLAGTTDVAGPMHIASLAVNNITGPVNLSAATLSYGDTAAAPKLVKPDSVAAIGSAKTPMKSDAQVQLDKLAWYRVMHPAGQVMEWPYAQLPQDILLGDGAAVGEWKWCDGSTVSATTYPSYSAVAGTTFGGTTGTPALPNFNNGRVPVGADGSHVLNTTGGSYSKTLSVGEMPNHTHTPNDPGHTHGIQNSNFVHSPPSAQNNYAPNAASQPPGANPAYVTFQPNTAPAQTGITLQATGGGAAFNIEQPWRATKYCVKVH